MGDGDDQLAFVGFAQRGFASGRMRFVECADLCAGTKSDGAEEPFRGEEERVRSGRDRKSTRLNSSHGYISYAVFCLKKKIHRGLRIPSLENKHFRTENYRSPDR